MHNTRHHNINFTLRHARRTRGSIYVVVMASAMLLLVIGVSSLLGGKVQRKQYTGYQQAMSATPIARSGIELAMHEIATNHFWRIENGSRDWWTKLAFNNGTLTVNVVDPIDNITGINPNEPIVITSTATVGLSKTSLQVELYPAPVDEHAYSNAVTHLQPFAYWPMLRDAGATCADSSYRYDGVYTNGVTLATGPGPNNDLAPYFDGMNDFVVVSHHDDLMLEDGSVSLWFQLQDATVKHYGILSKDANDRGEGGHLTIHVDVDGRILAKMQSTTTNHSCFSTQSVRTNTWYHVTYSWGAQGAQLYVNGEFNDSDPYTGGLGISSGGVGNHEPIVIGAKTSVSSDRSITGWNNPFKGYIYQVAMFNRQLTSDEIKALFDAGGLFRPLRITPGSFIEVIN